MPGNAGVEINRRQLARIRARVPNQRRFAQTLGINRATLCRIINGAERPSRGVLERICKALDLELEVRTLVEIRPKGALRGHRWSAADALPE